jgi:hypothetical protein
MTNDEAQKISKADYIDWKRRDEDYSPKEQIAVAKNVEYHTDSGCEEKLISSTSADKEGVLSPSDVLEKKIREMHQKSLNRVYITYGDFKRLVDKARASVLNDVLKIIENHGIMQDELIRELKQKLSEVKE